MKERPKQYNGRRWLMGYLLKGSINSTRCFDCHGVIDASTSFSTERQVSGPAMNDPKGTYSGDFAQRVVHFDRRECQREKMEQECAADLERQEKQSTKDSALGVVVPKPLKGESPYPWCWNCGELGVEFHNECPRCGR